MKSLVQKSVWVWVALFSLQFCTVPSPQEVAKTTFQTQIQPAFQQFDVPFEAFALQANEKQVLALENGTNIHIPAHAFVDKNGKTIKGKVDLQYREFHNTAQIIACGIPMDFEGQPLESGGMFEIRGSQGDTEVFIAADKNIQVEMASFTDEENFNHYFFKENKQQTAEPIAQSNLFLTNAYAQNTDNQLVGEQTAGEWVLLGESNIQPNKRKEEALAALDQEEALLKSYKGQHTETSQHDALDHPTEAQMTHKSTTKSKLPRGNRFFKLQFDLEKDPELEVFKDVMWKFTGNSYAQSPFTQRNKWVLEQKWAELSLTESNFKEAGQLRDATIKTAQFFPNVSRIITTSEKGHIKLWTATGKKIKKLSKHKGKITSLQFSPDGTKLLTTATDRNAILWDSNGKWIHSFKGHQGGVNSASFSADGSQIITCSADKTAKIWDVKTGKPLATLKNHRGSVLSAKFIEDTQKVFTYASDEKVRLWTKNGKLLREMEGTISWIKKVKFAPNGKQFLATLNNGLIQLFDENGERIENYHKRDNPSFSTDSQLFTGKEIRNIIGTGHQKVFFSDDGKLYTTVYNHKARTAGEKRGRYDRGSYYNEVAVWSKEEGLITRFTVPSEITEAQVSNDKKYIMTNAEEYFFREIEVENGKKKKIKMVRLISYLWDTSGNLLQTSNQTFRDHALKSYHNSFSPDSKYIMESVSAKDFSRVDKITHTYPVKTVVKLYERAQHDELMMQLGGEDVFFQTIVQKAKLGDVPDDILAHFGFTQEQLLAAMPSTRNPDAADEKDLTQLMQSYNAKAQKRIDAERARLQRQADLVRNFNVGEFGFWNCDRPFQFAASNTISIDACFDFGKELKMTRYQNLTVYLVMGERGTVIVPFDQKKWKEFRFNPKESTNKLLAVLPNDEVAIFTQKQFENMDKQALETTKKYEFEMQFSGKVHSAGELQRLIQGAG